MFVGVAAFGVNRYLEQLDDDYCRISGSQSIPFIGLVEDYRRTKGSYPVVTDVAALKAAIENAEPDSQRVTREADVAYDGDGQHYRLVVFPYGSRHAGDRCGCFIVEDGSFVVFPGQLSVERRQRLARQLDEYLAAKPTK